MEDFDILSLFGKNTSIPLARHKRLDAWEQRYIQNKIEICWTTLAHSLATVGFSFASLPKIINFYPHNTSFHKMGLNFNRKWQHFMFISHLGEVMYDIDKLLGFISVVLGRSVSLPFRKLAFSHRRVLFNRHVYLFHIPK